MLVDIFHQNHLWERLEKFVRDRVQRFIQALLEEEVTELLGRRKSPAGRRGMRLLAITSHGKGAEK